MYDLPVSSSDLFPILDFFVKSKLIFGLFSKKLFDSVAMAFSCFFYGMLSFPRMKENCFKTSCLIDINLKGNKMCVINIY